MGGQVTTVATDVSDNAKKTHKRWQWLNRLAACLIRATDAVFWWTRTVTIDMNHLEVQRYRRLGASDKSACADRTALLTTKRVYRWNQQSEMVAAKSVLFFFRAQGYVARCFQLHHMGWKVSWLQHGLQDVGQALSNGICWLKKSNEPHGMHETLEILGYYLTMKWWQDFFHQ